MSRGDRVKVYVVSDKTAAQPATLRVRLMDFDGKVLLEDSHEVSVDPLSSKVYLDWPLAKLAQAGGVRHIAVFVVAELSRQGTAISRNLTYLAPTKEVHLKPARLTVETTGANGRYTDPCHIAGAGAQCLSLIWRSWTAGIGQLLRLAARRNARDYGDERRQRLKS